MFLDVLLFDSHRCLKTIKDEQKPRKFWLKLSQFLDGITFMQNSISY
jgi:ribosomal protein L24E